MLEIFDIVYLSLVVFSLLKLIGDFHALNPLRVQVVHDHLGASQLLPELTLFLVQHYHSVCACERIQVGEVEPFECEADHVDQAAVVLETAVCGGEDGLVEITTEAHPALA